MSPAKRVVVVKMSSFGFFNINRFLIPTSALGFTKKKTNNSGHCATSGRILSAHRRTKLFPKERFGFLPSWVSLNSKIQITIFKVAGILPSVTVMCGGGITINYHAQGNPISCLTHSGVKKNRYSNDWNHTIFVNVFNLIMGDILRCVRISNTFRVSSAYATYSTFITCVGPWGVIIAPSGALIAVHSSTNVVFIPPKQKSVLFKEQYQAPRVLKVRGANVMIRRGQRPKVRGTVKNPNDHPHGGRTRSIARPQTPWGFARNTSRSVKRDTA